MQKKNDNFSMQDAMRLAKSDAGQQLLALLQQKDGSQLQQAMDQAAAGDYDQVQKTLSALMSSEDVKALLRQLEG